MKIKCTQHVEAEITWAEQLSITEKTIRSLLGWSHNTYLTVGGKVVNNVQYATSHSWNDQVELRDATSDDKALQQILNLITANRFKHK
jgi:hypothetical protein